ncbi:MAG: pimeloyl-ACP methyl ester carboxylesterase [Saprospiraceae bacterium]
MKKKLKNPTSSNISSIPFRDFGGSGQVLHFAHANGFHPATYQQLLNPLTKKFRVIGIEHRPFWQAEPTAGDDWEQIANDLIRFLEEQNLKSVIGVGHSLGAVATMFAAIKRPDLFKKVVLIEPVFLPVTLITFFQLVPQKWRKHLNPLIKMTLKRRDVWDSQQEVYDAYRKKKFFAGLSDEVLLDYINSGIKKRADGKVTLVYSKEWEAHFFSLAPKVWSKLGELKTPVLGIRGEHSDTLQPDQWTKWQRLKPTHEFLEIEGTGHLLPLEKPQLLADKILAFLK